jgi:hypothetical protein
MWDCLQMFFMQKPNTPKQISLALAQIHCNPAHFAELIGENNEWIFNSSAAKQANKWFGHFQSTIHSMQDACLKVGIISPHPNFADTAQIKCFF